MGLLHKIKRILRFQLYKGRLWLKKELYRRKRNWRFQLFKRQLWAKIQYRDKKTATLKFIEQSPAKKILIMNASPFVVNMFQQRPHHFLDFWAKHFDAVLYPSYVVTEPTHYKDNIYLVPYIPMEEFKGKDIYYYLSSVHCLHYKTFLKLKANKYKIIYDYYDEIAEGLANIRSAKATLREMERIDLDIIIATSDKLYTNIKRVHPKKDILLVKNGVTIEDFEIKSNEIPKDLEPILKEQKPIVGFYGYIAKWTDIKLLEQMAKERPQYNFILIGIIMSNVKFDYKKYPNIHFLGRKPYKDLVNYAKHFDCAILPFAHGNVAKATSPNKLFEHMAMGLPSVCTRDLFECRGYDGVLMSEDNNEFIKNIDKAIELSKDENIKQKLKNYAKQNSWEEKANEILEKIKELA